MASAPTAFLEGRAVCPLVHTPDAAVAAAVEIAQLRPDDCFLDLGCGDRATMLIAAAGAGCRRAVGIDV